MESFQNWLRSLKKQKPVAETGFETEPVFAGKSGK